jgi:putative membrane protein
MKTLYNASVRILALAGVMIFAVSCSGDLSYQEAINKNDRKIEDEGKRSDARFLVEAKSFNMLELKLSELASTTGYAASIVDLAKRNRKDFEKMNDEIEKLAAREKIALPESMGDEHQATFFEVSKADRQDFDKEYLLAMKKVNEANLERFLRMATDAKDADVRAFAARKLDMMRMHEQRVSEVDDKLLDTY